MDVLNDPFLIEHDCTTAPLENPFDTDAVHVSVPGSKYLALAQLNSEFTEAGLDVKLSLQSRTYEDDVLFITPPVPELVAEAIVEAHSPDPDYGLSDLAKAGRAALLKAREGETLTVEEISAYIGSFG